MRTKACRGCGKKRGWLWRLYSGWETCEPCGSRYCRKCLRSLESPDAWVWACLECENLLFEFVPSLAFWSFFVEA